MLFFATSCFDSTWKQNENGKYEPFYVNLDMCKSDCEIVRRTLKKFQVTDTGKDGIYNLVNDPTLVQVVNATADIRRRLKRNPDKLFLIFYMIAGHGM